MTIATIAYFLAALIHPGPQGENPAKPARVPWDFNFSIKAWFAEIEERRFSTLEQRSSGRSIVPQIQFAAVRRRFELRLNYQFAAAFSGSRQIGGNQFNYNVKAENLQALLKFELHQWNFPRKDLVLSGLLGYQRLVLLENDENTSASNEDFKRLWLGPRATLAATLRGGTGLFWNWDFDLQLSYAELQAEFSQQPIPSTLFTETWGYQSKGRGLDGVFKIYIPTKSRRDIQWLIGYRDQEHLPQIETVRVRQRILVDGGPEFTTDERPLKLKIRGWYVGFVFYF